MMDQVLGKQMLSERLSCAAQILVQNQLTSLNTV